MPHANDMTHWDAIECTRGHATHDTIVVNLPFGQHASYADYPKIPQRFHRDLEIEVWDYPWYMNGNTYCPGRDVVSETIHTLGVWEPAETTALLLAWERLGFDGWFIDIGSQLGWYSLLAGKFGMNVLAFDADPECVRLTDANLHRVGDQDDLFLSASDVRFGAGHIGFDPGGFGDMRVVVKIDVEGAEPEAVAALEPIIDKVDFMLIEISPVFHDRYYDLVVDLVAKGFEPHEVPPKHNPPRPLETLDDLKRFHLDRRAINEIPTWHQKNVLFVRGGL